MATTTESSAPTRSVTGIDSLVWLSLIIVASIALRLIVNTKFVAPTILTDELTYSQLAENVANGQFWLTGYGIVYPLLLSPAWLLAKSGTDAYTYMKAINAVIMSLTAVPVFMLARRFMRHGYALLAAGLTVLMPPMAFSGHIMTEDAFVLVFMFAVWAMVVAIERPTITNQALLVIAIFVAYETRTQALVLVIALPLAIITHAMLDCRDQAKLTVRALGTRVARFWPLAVLVVVAVVAMVIRSIAGAGSWTDVLQAYGTTAGGQYPPMTVARYFLWHLGEASFALGVAPVAALAAVLIAAVIGRTRSSSERAFAAVAVMVMPLTILVVAAFASYYEQRVNERNIFAVFPLAFVALALWLDTGLPRTRRTTAIAAAFAGAIVLCVPFEFLYQRSPSTETWAVVLPEFLSRKLSGTTNDVQILIVVGVTAALALFGVARPKVAAAAIPLVLVAYFAASQAAVVHTVSKVAAADRAVPSLGADASWLEQAVPSGTTVGFVSGTLLNPNDQQTLWWETGFFNRTNLQWISWGTDVVANPATGIVTAPDGSVPALPPLLLTPISAHFAGRVVADRGSYILVAPAKPYRLLSAVGGVYADGWTGPQASIDVFDTTLGSTVNLTFARPISPAGTAIRVVVAPLEVAQDGNSTVGPAAESQSVEVAGANPVSLSVQSLSNPYRITITTQSSFTPSSIGLNDPRELGVVVQASSGQTTLVP